ncbi:MAG: TlyA family RNA methyltransferase [Oscillospiraceae bacterium]|nr:TlyA family RNA methyltransferase [Oscillospiraceae bacterium]MBP1575209.1 TlyA family RNA methyltransferase [Oscillospiraceae bacterium]MBQ8595410.1 TlyA family RNA methyltransferase [Oscillospiraceae bacterium]
MSEKQRLDAELVARGIIQSREQAKAAIMAGQVYVNNQKADKAGESVSPEDKIEFRGEKLAYVSRGGLKLEKAMELYGFKLDNKICMDVGASTGGFTDCMLQKGATKVYSIDVGYGQLAWKLRQDERVVNLERTNVRYITTEQVPDIVDFVSIDVSFISLGLVIPVLVPFLSEEAMMVCLVKPQFEAGKEKVGKHGVVRDPATHMEVLERAVGFAKNAGFGIVGLEFSPIKGPQGNIEYLMVLTRKEPELSVSSEDIKKLVESSHSELD